MPRKTWRSPSATPATSRTAIDLSQPARRGGTGGMRTREEDCQPLVRGLTRLSGFTDRGRAYWPEGPRPRMSARRQGQVDRQPFFDGDGEKPPRRRGVESPRTNTPMGTPGGGEEDVADAFSNRAAAAHRDGRGGSCDAVTAAESLWRGHRHARAAFDSIKTSGRAALRWRPRHPWDATSGRHGSRVARGADGHQRGYGKRTEIDDTCAVARRSA